MRAPIALLSVAVAATLLAPTGSASAEPTPPPGVTTRDFGNGPERNDEAAGLSEQTAGTYEH